MGRIPEDIINQVLDHVDIVEVVSSYVPLKKSGRNFKACCPFHHEKTPSFIVNPDKQIFHCFGCGVGGNVFTFVSRLEHLEFPKVVRMLAEKVNIVVPDDFSPSKEKSDLRQQIFQINQLAVGFYHKRLLTDKTIQSGQVRAYLKNRGVTLQSVEELKLGYAPDQWDELMSFLKNKDIPYHLIEKAGLIIPRDNKPGFYDRFRNRVIFPIFDSRERCRAFGGRTIEQSSAKYINSPETLVYTKGQHLYGFHLAKSAILQENYVIVVEGYLDFVLPFQSGIKNVVAALGTALTVEQIRLIRRYTQNIVLLFDRDDAGELAMTRSLDLLMPEDVNVKVAGLEEGHDPDSYIRQFGVDAFRHKVEQAESFFDFKLSSLKKSYDCRSVEGKSKIAEEMLSLLVKIKRPIVQSEYIHRLANILALKEDILLAELRRINQVPGALSTALKEDKKERLHSNQLLEYNLIKLMLENHQFIPEVRNSLSIDDFQDATVREIITKIYETFDKEKLADIASFICQYQNTSFETIMSELCAEEHGTLLNKDIIFNDYLNRLYIKKIKLRRAQIVPQIEEAKIAGDLEIYNKLMRELNDLPIKL